MLINSKGPHSVLSTILSEDHRDSKSQNTNPILFHCTNQNILLNALYLCARNFWTNQTQLQYGFLVAVHTDYSIQDSLHDSCQYTIAYFLSFQFIKVFAWKTLSVATPHEGKP